MLLCPWDSPGKNTGVHCHSLLWGIFPTQGSKPGLLHCRQILYHLKHQGNLHTHTACMLSHHSCTRLCNSMDCSPPGSSVRGILQVRILELVFIPCSRGSSQPRNQTQLSCIAGRFSTVSATAEALLPNFTHLFSSCLPVSQECRF